MASDRKGLEVALKDEQDPSLLTLAQGTCSDLLQIRRIEPQNIPTASTAPSIMSRFAGLSCGRYSS